MADYTSIAFEDALLGGFDKVLNYYEPFICNLARTNAVSTRAPLNEKDLEQHCRSTLHKCWKMQCSTVGVRNFDLLAKQSMQNTVRTLIGKEFCKKRGYCEINFFSDMEHSTARDGEEEQSYEHIIFRQSEDRPEKEGWFDIIMTHLDTPHLQRTFTGIIENFSPRYLSPFKLSEGVKAKLAAQLKISCEQLENDLFDIWFILTSSKDTFRPFAASFL